MRPLSVLETVLYAEDLDAARNFYRDVLGLECFMQEAGRHVFFRCGDQVLLIFDPRRTEIPVPLKPGVPPVHGGHGPGHVCFKASAAALDAWRDRLIANDIDIETEFEWRTGGRSLYVRDPAGNSVEFAEPRIWKLVGDARTLRGGKLVVATHNKGKLREIAELVASHDVEAVSAGDLGLPEPEETGATFVANAILKAEAASIASGLPALADDSGLCVDALDGEPGIYSARWAGPDKDFSRAMRNVEEKLQAAGAREPAQRGAHFIAALSLAWPDGLTEVFEGHVDGTLVWPPRGTKGFGYDPMFLPEGEALTFGEIEPVTKHGISHRARAFAKLKVARLG
jgi:XTP/dITP diphosphohydrolase